MTEPTRFSAEYRASEADARRLLLESAASFGALPLAPESVARFKAELNGPFWRLTADDGSFCIVDARLAKVVGGRLPADPWRARARLGFFLGVAIAIASVTGNLTFVVGELAMRNYHMLAGDGRSKVALVPPLIALSLVAFYMSRLFRRLPPALVEPTLQVATGAVRFPTPQAELWLLRALGWTALAAAAVGAVSKLPAALIFFPAPAAIGAFFQQLGWLGLEAVLAFVAFRAASISKAPTEPPVGDDALVAETPIGRIVRSCVLVILAGLLGSTLGTIFDLFRHRPGAGLPPIDWVLRGAEIGALVALAIAPLKRVSKVAAIAGILADFVLGSLLHPLIGLALGLIAVALPHLLSELRTRGRRDLQRILWESATRSWAFHLGAGLGKILGFVLGLFVFGTGGAAIGTVLGERLGGLLGLTAAGEELN